MKKPFSRIVAGRNKTHQTFLELLGKGAALENEDFRASLLKNRLRPYRIGFKRKNLVSAFSANLTRLFPGLIAVDDSEIDSADPVLMYGAILEDPEKSHDSTQKLMPHVRATDHVIFFEMGFLASPTSWSQALASGDPGSACLGYVFDDRAQYYMADYETRLTEKLNGEFHLTPQERERACRLMHRIVDARISKYNSQPFFMPPVSPRHDRRVLVVDQTFADASIAYGHASEDTFKNMLDAALRENPDAEILIKTHPDINWADKGTRRGYFDHMKSEGRVRILRDSVNPFQIFDLVDKVYVGTSGLGFEALLAGKQVACFGAPWYAGWGLTDDRVPVPHRHRQRSLAELFHAFYIWYTIYHLPDGEVPSTIESVLDYIEEKRPVRPIPTTAPSAPLLSIVIPVHQVERYVAECLGSIQRQSLQDFEIILIDDLSTDKSADIISAFAAGDPRIRLIRGTENIGPGFARNQGMAAARGTYILFIDPDDYMPDPAHLERVIAMAETDGADMVRYRKRHEQLEDPSGKIIGMRKDTTETFFPDEIRQTTLARTPQIAHSRHFWNWLYRRDFLDRHGVRFLTTYREERAFLMQAYMADPVVSVCDSDGVVYRIRHDSAVRRSQSMSDVIDQLTNFDQVIEQLDKGGALDPSSPNWWLTRFQVSQFLHYLYFGFAWKVAKAEHQADHFIDLLARTLERSRLAPSDLIEDPSQLSEAHRNCGAYSLLMAATCCKRRDLIETALNLAPVEAPKLYEELLLEPATTAQERLQGALNNYARNERVVPVPASAASVFKKPRLIIHIGSTKTGSTVLQHTLEDHRPTLLRQGIWYPEVGLFWQKNRPHKQAGHAGFIAEAISGGSKLRDHLLQGLAAMEGRIHTIVLSSEAFFLSANAAKIARLFHDFDVEMVVYLRRQDEWANSQYAEFVAGGAINSTSLTFEEWLQTDQAVRGLDYKRIIHEWEQYLPKSAIHPRCYVRSSGGNWDIVKDFAEVTRLSPLQNLPVPAEEKLNTSRLSAAHVELIRQYNKKKFASKPAYCKFIDIAGSQINLWRKDQGMSMSSPWFLNDILATDIMDRAAVGNDWIAREFFATTGDMLFPPRAEAPADCAVHLAEFRIVDAAYAMIGSGKGRTEAKSDIVNYGLFSWRRWSAIPALTAVYRYRGRPDLAKALSSNPVEFARQHWAGRHPRLRWLAYSTANPLGPREILRHWTPLVVPYIRRNSSDHAANEFLADPIRFSRRLQNPVHRMVARILFPMGELR
ncbi:glycosyltransferase [Thioclava sp.]|uniref:glycosyltransferase n=1 Tax=Thioclava sp. TaxID=1933450 RepID=UPI003242EFFE